MTKILSQEEVDSLLTGIGEGKIETGTGVPDSVHPVTAYDFRRENAPVHLKLSVLGTIHERFARLLRTSLSAALGSEIRITLSETQSVKFSEFFQSLVTPAILNLFRMDPLRGFGLLVLEGSLVFAFVDSLLGGKCARQVKVEARPFTPIEKKIIEKIAKTILAELQQAWVEVHEVRMGLARSETDPQAAVIVNANDLVVTLKIKVDMGTFAGNMLLCAPYSTLEPLKEILTRSVQREKLKMDERWVRHLEQRIRELKINVNCILGKAKIKGKDLLSMKIDDVIELDQRVDDPILVSLAGIPKFRGFLGSLQQKKAIKIDGKISED